MGILPSGEQHELRFGAQAVTVVEVGGGIRSYRLGDWEVLDGYGPAEMCSGGRGQILVPWPNRIDEGRYEFGGRSLQLPLTEPPKQNAIHGLARWSAWSFGARGESRATLEHVIHAQAGYPFSVGVRVSYALGEGGLAVRTSATNLGSEPCPWGSGAHPYIEVDDRLIDGAILCFAAETWLESDARGIPTGRAAVAGSPFDFREPRPLGGTVIDTAFTGLEGDLTLSSADGARIVRVWRDANHPYLMLFTGDTLPEAARRRQGLGVEPMTCAPNAFVSGDGLRVLQPGETFSAEWGIEPRAQQA